MGRGAAAFRPLGPAVTRRMGMVSSSSRAAARSIWARSSDTVNPAGVFRHGRVSLYSAAATGATGGDLLETSEASEAGPFGRAMSSDRERSMEAIASTTSSSSRIWCRMDILFSSSDTFWDIRRQPSQAECEVSEVAISMGSGERRQLWPVKVILVIYGCRS